MREIAINTPEIRLGQLLKWAGLAETGGRARILVEEGQVLVNGQKELRLGRRLVPGDRVSIAGSGEGFLLVHADGEA